MSNVTREHRAGLELAVKSCHQLMDTQLYSKMLELIAQASAAPEQEAVAWMVGKTVWENRSAAVRNAADRMRLVRPLYTHADDGELERLRAELVESDLCVVRALNERDAALKQLAKADQKISSVVEYVEGMVKAAGNQPSVATGYLRDILDALLSATAQPAECDSCEPAGVFATDGSGPHDCPDCGKKAAAQMAGKEAGSQAALGVGGAARPADDMCNHDNPAARCICREEFGHRVCAQPADGVKP